LTENDTDNIFDLWPHRQF